MPRSSDPVATASLAPPLAEAARPAWRDYLELTKPEIAFLVALSALAGYLLGAPAVGAVELAALLVGTTLSAGGSGVLNHVLERDLDRRMRRTADRPIPAGRVSARAAATFGALLVMTGVGLLCPLTNPLTGILSALTVVLYLFVYTPLKRRTKYNTLVGTIPGALPALGGWTAATGSFGATGWVIFGILALWQMPHFLALAWMYRKDYARGGYAMLTVVEPDGDATVRQTLGFTVALVALSFAPALLGAAGWLYVAAAALLGAGFLVPAWAFYRSRTATDARRVLMASIRYVPLLVLAIALDRLLA